MLWPVHAACRALRLQVTLTAAPPCSKRTRMTPPCPLIQARMRAEGCHPIMTHLVHRCSVFQIPLPALVRPNGPCETRRPFVQRTTCSSLAVYGINGDSGASSSASSCTQCGRTRLRSVGVCPFREERCRHTNVRPSLSMQKTSMASECCV
ncbi:hypothetical protein M427DRAFT_182272 [Gonapodya prolifera JEL478]|uniref:Secreted protein n=1 Tax=Gonapodya prolifera (strain JEL478) TaxID=1344416 RepID=A0A139A1A4_GONPJ|nr:hypothetical protein M427DRAFT_182272 [Gonapodya prolifera JEL478]|eukprot:KXS10315.1 hypothetical protein M427DRAFT_182272 [Gonapodya prolifera JEL478]